MIFNKKLRKLIAPGETQKKLEILKQKHEQTN